ncbi:MAG: glycosyltransferase family 39 protein [Vicinamibacterales bacterium]
MAADRRSPPLPTWLPLALVLVCVVPLYLWRLGAVPAFGGDEARFVVHANAIATTGHDLDGKWLPLLVRIEEYGVWYQPGLFYLIAATLKIAPLAEWSVRLPTALIGILDVVLIYFVARRLLGGVWYAALAALMLALTPAHLLLARQALDYICPLPFFLGWLWCLLVVLETGSMWTAVLAGLLLGLGLYSHLAAWAMMPLCLVMTWAALAASARPLRLMAAVGVGFAVPLLPLLVWLNANPEMLRAVATNYHVYDTQRLSPMQGAKDFLNYNGIETRLSVYWDYFNPGYLFMSGGANLTTATRRAGVFLMALALFLPCGLYYLWSNRKLPVALVLLVAFLAAPLWPALVDSRYLVQREIFALPAGVLIAAFGAAWLLSQRPFIVRLATVLLIAGMPVQYYFFYSDYVGDYVTRSATWFDPASFSHIADYVVPLDTATPVPAVYLSDALDDGLMHWRFQVEKRGRAELRLRSHFVDLNRFDLSQAAPSSLLVLYASDPKLGQLTGPDTCCVLDKTILDPAGNPSAVVLRRR